jgi:hypothetical protein
MPVLLPCVQATGAALHRRARVRGVFSDWEDAPPQRLIMRQGQWEKVQGGTGESRPGHAGRCAHERFI